RVSLPVSAYAGGVGCCLHRGHQQALPAGDRGDTDWRRGGEQRAAGAVQVVCSGRCGPVLGGARPRESPAQRHGLLDDGSRQSRL
ncbi:unnamed protein product, partial [Lampetra fluviatilis]